MLDQESGQQIDRDGLVLWLPLNGSVTEYSGSGVVATAMGSPTYTDGQHGRVLSLNGASKGVRFTTSGLPVGAAQRTVSIRFKALVENQVGLLISYGNNNQAYKRFALFYYYTSNSAWLFLEASGIFIAGIPFTFDTNWHTLQAVYPPGQTSTNQVQLSLDGIRRSETYTSVGTLNTSVSNSSGVWAEYAGIGAYIMENNGTPQYYNPFSGLLCDARVYNVGKAQSRLLSIHRWEA